MISALAGEILSGAWRPPCRQHSTTSCRHSVAHHHHHHQHRCKVSRIRFRRRRRWRRPPESWDLRCATCSWRPHHRPMLRSCGARTMSTSQSAASAATSPVGKTASSFEFSLCLSRACLGKMFVFIYKWLKNAVFPQGRRQSNRIPVIRCSNHRVTHLPSDFSFRSFRACLGKSPSMDRPLSKNNSHTHRRNGRRFFLRQRISCGSS